jgi:phosphate transport system protein
MEMAQRVLADDVEVDNTEIDVEEDCLKILALHQPVAVDLRFIVAALKINNDLERIGDLAVNIAERSLALASKPEFELFSDIQNMCEKAVRMLKSCLDSFIALDFKQALAVCAADDEVDGLYREMYEKIRTGIAENPLKTDEYLQSLSISRHLERIADHSGGRYLYD